MILDAIFSFRAAPSALLLLVRGVTDHYMAT
jgi:hypothetical protein